MFNPTRSVPGESGPNRVPRELRADGPLLEDPDATLTAVVSPPTALRRKLVLHVHHKDGSRFVDLPVSGVIQIGRDPAADVVLRDASVSRAHAVLTLGETIDLTDLGSRNGTRVGNAPLQPRVAVRVEPYQLIMIGSVSASVELVPDLAASDRVLHPAEFEAYLDETARVARRTGADLSIVAVTLERSPGFAVVKAALQEVLGTDCIAQYGERQYRALLRDVPVADGEEKMAQLAARLGDGARVRAQHLFHTEPEEVADPERGPIVVDPAMVAAYAQVRQLAAGKISILINGETGAGKEYLAEEAHRASPRARAPFLRLNCAALSDTLLESELFGHEKGAFTGAAAAKPGLLEAATGGTLFLDEVGELSLSAQAKLLRCLESGTVLRVGAVKPRPIDVRFVSATNRNLLDEVEKGTFREDLYYRIAAATVVVPPLRQRPLELPALANRFCLEAARDLGRSTVPMILHDTLELLLEYGWPGNVRELRNVIHRAVLLAKDRIEPAHLPQRIAGETEIGSSEPVVTQEPKSEPSIPALPTRGDEHQRILDALSQSGGNQTEAARLLGISRVTLAKRLEQYNIPRPRKR